MPSQNPDLIDPYDDEGPEDSGQPEDGAADGIAIVGLAGRFPQAADVATFWRQQLDGFEAVRTLTPEELSAAGVSTEQQADPAYVPVKGVIEDYADFDADFFGLSPREAEIMDPQHRLFLETCWQAIEDAGYDPARLPGPDGVSASGGRGGIFAGCTLSSYLLSNLLSRPDVIAQVGPVGLRIHNDNDSVSTWVAYKLGLEGPSVTVQTACSTSLTAVHFACQSLLNGECDVALAGGVSLTFPMHAGYPYHEGGIQSQDGRCRPFDARASGTVGGTGAGAVVLKRLDDALADGDTIRAVVRASAISNDGARRAGFTAPGVEGQARAIAEALTLADVDPGTVAYVETHGSATKLGDPIEFRALVQAFQGVARQLGTPVPVSSCALGSAKANVGHLDAAAGITGFIRAASAVESGRIPPCLHFETANPAIELDGSPFYVPTAARAWPERQEDGQPAPRRAGVSSFGLGGTNVHAVLEQAPPPEPLDGDGEDDGDARPWQLLLLSARSDAAADAAAERLAAHLEEGKADATSADLADTAYTLHAGRRPFRRRRAVVVRAAADAVEVLRGTPAHRLLRGALPKEQDNPPGVAFLFPGLGEHHAGMARELYRHEPAFRAALDACAEHLRRRGPEEGGLDVDLLELLFPRELFPHGSDAATASESEPPAVPGAGLRQLLQGEDEEKTPAQARLDRTRYAHPATFAVEFALAQTLISWGLRPKALCGYSLGEYVAACVAGVFTLGDALDLVVDRARWVDELPEGALLAVPLSEDDVRSHFEALSPEIASELAIAAANGASLTVVGGSPDAVDRLTDGLDAAGIACRRIPTVHAFHTPRLEPLRSRLAERVASVPRQAPKIPFLSNLSGTWILDDEAQSPDYWADHLVRPVRFTDALDTLVRDPDLALVEVGPGQALATLARQHPSRVARADGSAQTVVTTLGDRREPTSELARLLTAVGRLWLAGVELPEAAFYAGQARRRVPLPTYPFERKPYFVEPGTGTGTALEAAPSAKPADLADWAWRWTWQRDDPTAESPQQLPDDRQGEPCLLFAPASGPGSELAVALQERLESAGAAVTLVSDTDLRAGDRPGYSRLLASLTERDALPHQIVWLRPLDLDVALDEAQDRAFYGLLFLAQALGEQMLHHDVRITVVTDRLHDVTGDEDATDLPLAALALGPVQVLPQEYPRLQCSQVDLDLRHEPARLAEQLAQQLLNPDTPRSPEPAVAYRGSRHGHRWLRRLDTRPLPPAETPSTRLRAGGTYLITGALDTVAGLANPASELALSVAEHLSAAVSALGEPPCLLLQGPAHLAPIESWPERTRQRVQALETRARVEILRLDLGASNRGGPDADAWREALAAQPVLHGIVHAAAVAGAGVVQLKTRSQAEPVLAPKVAGTLALLDAARAADRFDALDFVVYSSSVLALIGGAGQVDFAAANNFLDALARHGAGLGTEDSGSGCWIGALAWDTFAWERPDPLLPEPLRSQLEDLATRFGIGASEAVELFQRSLAGRGAHTLLSPRPLPALFAQYEAQKSGASQVGTAGTGGEGASAGAPGASHARPDLDTEYRAPSSETEDTLAGLWQNAFGIDRVGVDDNFFELEGTSLIALQVATHLRAALKVDLPVAALFESPTIAELASRIDRLRQEEAELAEADALLAEIEGLSDEEAAALLAEEA